MRFILESDYPSLIRDEIRNVISIGYNDTKLITAENMAISQIKNYLAGRYDVATIFQGFDPDTESDIRSHYMVMLVIDCTLYHLYTNTAPDRIPQHRSTRYQDAIDWLKLIAEGKTNADLPAKAQTAEKPAEGVRIGSKYPNSTYRY
ncbi:MAG: DUF1320 family protein [Crocinitomicaceae bacterium]|nr:DUF1320 family protein [Crocinitomicaceae bacterium]